MTSLRPGPLSERDARFMGVGLLTIIIVILFYPGVMTNDSEAALAQARSMALTDWHPPVMALLWRYLDAVIRGPVLMLVCQALLYGWAVAKVCVEGFPEIRRRVALWALVPLFGMFPPAMALIGMIWKDVWMSGLLLLALGYLYSMVGSRTNAERLRSFALLTACCLGATAFRHNAVSATAGLLAGGCYFLLTDRRENWVRLGVACVGGLTLAAALWLANGFVIRTITTPSHPTTSILLHDIAGTIARAEDPRAEAAIFLANHPEVSARPLDDFMLQLERQYDPGDANGVLLTSRRRAVPFDVVVYNLDHNAKAVTAAWRDVVGRNLRPYLAHRWAAFRCLMQTCDPERWATRSYVLNKRYLGTDSSSAVQARLRNLLLDPTSVRIYSPALWLLVCFAAAAASLLLGRGRSRVPLFMGLSALGLSVALFFTSPIGSYRYMHWAVLLGWTCIFLAVDVTLAKLGNHRQERFDGLQGEPSK